MNTKNDWKISKVYNSIRSKRPRPKTHSTKKRQVKALPNHTETVELTPKPQETQLYILKTFEEVYNVFYPGMSFANSPETILRYVKTLVKESTYPPEKRRGMCFSLDEQLKDMGYVYKAKK